MKNDIEANIVIKAHHAVVFEVKSRMNIERSILCELQTVLGYHPRGYGMNKVTEQIIDTDNGPVHVYTWSCAGSCE